MIFGPFGLGVAPKNPPVAGFFAEVGKLLLMFFVGLEIDIDQFNRIRNRSMIYGILTFSAPILASIAVGHLFGYGWLAAGLIAYEANNPDGVRLKDESIVNTVIMLMVVTSILGPILTEQFGKRTITHDRA